MHGSPRGGAPAGRELPTLAARLDSDGPLGVEEGVALLASLLEQLVSLHRFERPHGALGPDAVFLGPADGPRARLGLPDHTGGTRVPGHVAPERRPGDPPTPEGDVWALGAVMFRALAGRLPEGTAAGGLEPLVLAAPGVPFRLGWIVGSMLAADPDLRPSAEEALAAVRALREAGWPAARAEDHPSPEAGARREPGPFGRLGRLFRRDAAPVPDAAPGPAAPRPAGSPSLALLCLDDLGPTPRTVPAPPSDEGLQTAVDETLSAGLRVRDLPTFPSIALEVVEAARREDVGANELVRLINRDPALTAAVLRMANSAFSSRGVEVASARDAVTRLGLREVANLAAAAATRTLFDPDRSRAYRVVAETGRLAWIHSLTSALSASWLAMECGADTQAAFLGGMLHDVGKTLALQGFGRVLEEGRLRGVDPEAVVGPVLEATHVELGLRLARAWNLPAPVVRACAEHHRPRASPREDRELHLVRVVSALASLRLDPAWSLDRVREAQESATLLGFDRFRVRATAAQVRVLAARAEALAAA